MFLVKSITLDQCQSIFQWHFLIYFLEDFFFYWTYLFVYTKLLLWKWNSCSLLLHTKFQQIVSEIFIFPRLAGAQLSIFYATLKDNSEIFEIIICNFAVLEFYNTQVKCLVY